MTKPAPPPLPLRSFTVWRFLSPSTGETRIVARNAEPGDRKHQHEYQTILWAGNATDKAEALAMAGAALA